MSNISKLYIITIFASLAIHLLIGGGIYSTKLPTKKKNLPIEFEVSYSKKKKSRQIVRETHLADNIIKPIITPYISRFQKSFKTQTKAQAFGLTKNRAGFIKRKVKTKIRRNMPNYNKNNMLMSDQKSVGQSTISDDIPHVKNGFVTALNTNKEFFYTFFERTSEQIINRWQVRVSELIQDLNSKGLKKYSKKPQISTLEIILTKDGHFIRANLIHKAQFRLLDQAAINSFINAAPFLNPPKGLVEDDGRIHLRYSFRVDLRPFRIVRQRQ